MTKKNRKKKPRRSSRPHVIKEKNDANISEAIGTITNSFIENSLDGEIPDFESLVNLSIIAWNMSLFPETNQETLYGQIVQMLPESFGAQDTAGFVSIIERMMYEKKRHYPKVNRLIEKYNIFTVEGKMKLDVESIPFGSSRK
jgi:hypothetical protein